MRFAAAAAVQARYTYRISQPMKIQTTCHEELFIATKSFAKALISFFPQEKKKNIYWLRGMIIKKIQLHLLLIQHPSLRRLYIITIKLINRLHSVYKEIFKELHSLKRKNCA